MSVFEMVKNLGHEQVVFCNDEQSGLKAIVAIHNTILGPALGGTRMWKYNSEEDALRDVLRLSRGMTYKAAVAGLNLGGGKAVIIGDSHTDKNEILFRSFGRFVDSLAGKYITAEDVGTSVKDMEWVRMETKYVTGIPVSLGGSGDPSPVTGYGVYVGMKACANECWGNDSLKGKKIVVQGAGKVASALTQHIFDEGANIFITDIDQERIKAITEKMKVTVIKPEEVFDIEADIFSPNALGAIINDKTIDKLKVKIIAGGANNQMEVEEIHGKKLQEKGIIYAPDYVINAGGLINVAHELEGYSRERALKHAEGIYDAIKQVFAISKQENILVHQASAKLAEKRMKEVGRIGNMYSGSSNFSGRFSHLYKR